MCGIAGFLEPGARTPQKTLLRKTGAMTSAIAHRGPDDSGAWADERCGVALGQRRLAIIDLSPGGHQPMTSHSGRYVVTLNGEIYNFRQLRQELKAAGIAFSSSSDTEVLLAAIEKWGFREALDRANGMFAIALWDRTERRLRLARDRYGQKPLYLGWVGPALVFASELKAMTALEGFAPVVNRNVVSLYMRHGYVPEPHCIWQGIQKLTPGTIACIDPDTIKPGEIPAHEAYWQARGIARSGAHTRLPDSPQTLDELDSTLRTAVRDCMTADVPLGAFLSGGVDSSTVVALMQQASTDKVRTFSIGFHESPYNEAEHAASVARHLGTDHTEFFVSHRDAMEVIPRLPVLYDEPFADSSQIPAFLVSRLARQHVTVALSGDGGDELFGGYNRYVWAQNIARGMKALPSAVRRRLCAALLHIPVAAWDRVLERLPRRFRYQHPGDKIHKLATVMGAPGPEQAYWCLTSLWQNPDDVVRHGNEPATVLGDVTRWPPLDTLSEKMMVLDSETYLPGDILTKVDRASMAVGLEARVPLLDHRVAELAARLPLSMKIRGGTGKWALRQVLYRYVPQAMIERPKMGFGVPIDHWLRGELRDWAEGLLAEKALADGGIFDPVPIRKRWHDHLSNRRNWQHHLWVVLMYQAWSRAWSQV